jgi:hypothetical protein
MKIKIQNFNCAKFSATIKRMKSVNESAFFCFSKSGVQSRVSIARTFAKIVSVGWEEMLEVDAVSNVTKVSELFDKPVMLSFDKAQGILDILNNFSKSKTTLTIDTHYDENAGVHYAIKVTLTNDRLSINAFCRDRRLDFNYMDDDAVKRALNLATSEFVFELTSNDCKQFKDIMKLSEQDFITIRKIGNRVLLHKGNDVKLVVDEECMSDGDFNVNALENFFLHADTDYYQITVCTGKVIMKSLSDNSYVFFGLRETEDEDDVEVIETDELF